MTYVLDTDTCIWLLRERPSVLARVQRALPGEIAIAVMTEAELRYGAIKSGRSADNLTRLEDLLATPFASLPFDRDAARHHAEIRYALRARPIGDRDLVIASVARAHRATLVTGNGREFGRVPGLEIEDWSGRP